jgi:hypothetical protein
MSTIYQLVENVKQYVEIGSIRSGGGVNNMKTSKSLEGSVKSGGGVNSMQRSKLRIKSVSLGGGANNMHRSNI